MTKKGKRQTPRASPDSTVNQVASTSQNPAQLVATMQTNVRLIETKSGICPFPGRVNGVLTRNLESFITSVDAVIVTKNLTDPEATLAEGLSHLEIGKGDISHFVRYGIIEDCKSWVELRAALRRLYGTQSDIDIALQLREIVKLQDRRGRSYVANTATINDYLKEFIARLSNSNWVTNDSKNLKNLSLLLKLAVSTASLPDALVRVFDKPFTKNSNGLMF